MSVVDQQLKTVQVTAVVMLLEIILEIAVMNLI
jgi:hypothetical protein